MATKKPMKSKSKKARRKFIGFMLTAASNATIKRVQAGYRARGQILNRSDVLNLNLSGKL